MLTAITDQETIIFDGLHHRRWLAGRESVVHCHHYNSQLQLVIENNTHVDGKKIYRDAAAAVFAQQLRETLNPDSPHSERWNFCERLYSLMAYGLIRTEDISEGYVVADTSHFVEGWRASFAEGRSTVCSLTAGFLEGAYYAIHGTPARVREIECAISGAPQCRFEVIPDAACAAPFSYKKVNRTRQDHTRSVQSCPSNIDEAAILKALSEMQIQGGENGLMSAFNVYLANTPADFYNIVSNTFVETMEAKGMGEVARTQLVDLGEMCGLNTFHGIRESAEWDALIAPMVQNREDELHALVAVSNGLGWGRWALCQLEPEESMELKSNNGYEAIGRMELQGRSSSTNCHMLAGVASGLFSLTYGHGSIQDRFGQSIATEETCLCTGDDLCTFHVEVA